MSSIAFRLRSGRPRRPLLLVQFQYAHEGLLRNLHITYLTHTFLTFLLFLKKFLLTCDITAVTLRKYVLTNGLNGLTCNDLSADCCLDRNLKQMSRELFF